MDEHDRDALPQTPVMQDQYQYGHPQPEFLSGSMSCSTETDNQNAYYPSLNSPIEFGLETPHTLEQDPFGMPWDNGMSTIFDQKSSQYPSVPHGFPNSPSSLSGSIPIPSPDQGTTLSFDDFTPAPRSSMPHPFKPAALPCHQPQPQPQPQLQSHFTATSSTLDRPLPFGGYYFQNFEQANAFLTAIVWFPSMGNYGFPHTDTQYRFYLNKIIKALSNTKDVWDEKTASWSFSKFTPGGEWTGPMDIEAIAHNVMHTALKMHLCGLDNFAHRRSIDYMSFNAEDIDCTFTQRIHFLAVLLSRSKYAAAEVMTRENMDKYVATPITILRSFPEFEEFWTKGSDMGKKLWLESAPYAGSGVVHPSEEVQRDLAATSQARYLKVVERQRIDLMCASPASSLGNPMPVTGHQEASMFRKRSYTASSGPHQDNPMAKRMNIG